MGDRQSLDMKGITRPKTTKETAEIAYRIPGGQWKRRIFQQEKSSGVFFRGAWTLDEFIEHLLEDGAEIRWGDAR